MIITSIRLYFLPRIQSWLDVFIENIKAQIKHLPWNIFLWFISLKQLVLFLIDSKPIDVVSANKDEIAMQYFDISTTKNRNFINCEKNKSNVCLKPVLNFTTPETFFKRAIANPNENDFFLLFYRVLSSIRKNLKVLRTETQQKFPLFWSQFKIE